MQKRTVFVLFLLIVVGFPCFGGCSESKSDGPPPGRPNGFPNNIWYDAENKHPWTDVFDEKYQIDYKYATGIPGIPSANRLYSVAGGLVENRDTGGTPACCDCRQGDFLRSV